MPHDVFVSHSSKDKLTADAVVAVLESKGIRCWVAPRDIVPGADWSESIIDALSATKLMVLVFSANANASPQIKREVERAVNRGKPIIPLRIEDVAPTKSLEYFISTPHWLDAFTPPLERHLQYLTDVVARILVGPPETAASPTIGDAAEVMSAPQDVNASPPLDEHSEFHALGPEGPDPSGTNVSAAEIETAPVPSVAPSDEKIASDQAGSAQHNANVPVVLAGVFGSVILLFVVIAAVTATRPGQIAVATPPPPSTPAPQIAVAPTPAPAPIPDQQQMEMAYWDRIKDSKNAADYEEYLKVYPHGAFINLARNQIAALKRVEAPHQPTTQSLAELAKQGDAAFREQRYADAFRLYKRAAAGGSTTGMFRLGYMYLHGNGVAIDYGEAMQWYRRAADLGSTAGMFNVAALYQNGQGVTQDYHEAMQWYLKAADRGETYAMAAIGILYAKGWGVAKDCAVAKTWFEKGANVPWASTWLKPNGDCP